MSCFVDLYSALWNRMFGLDQYAKIKSQAGQRSLFGGEHDVSNEPRDANGKWAIGGARKSEKPDVGLVDSRATLRQESKSASGDTTVKKQPKSKPPVTAEHFEELFEQYIDALKARDAAAELKYKPRHRNAWRKAVRDVKQAAAACKKLDPEGDYPEAQ